MKRFWTELGTALLLGILTPALLMNTARMLRQEESEIETQAEQSEATTLPQPQEQKIMIEVLIDDDSIVSMDIETYVLGVVLGEMPVSFDAEAQKAQAVVARTYALRAREYSAKHPGGAVCTDSDCCQGYKPPEDFLADGGEQSALDRVAQAVAETKDLVLTYEGTLIEATYFSSSGGRTEDALAVWGNDVPYLRATDSPEDDYADQYLQTVTISAQSFQDALGITLDGPCETWLGEVAYTAGGGVARMRIGESTFEGTEIRQLLGLRSTAFIMTAVGDSIIITTRGFGHRVGMSQYGAEAMAVSGSSFREILSHYYQGTTLEEYIDKSRDFG